MPYTIDDLIADKQKKIVAHKILDEYFCPVCINDEDEYGQHMSIRQLMDLNIRKCSCCLRDLYGE